MPRGKNKQPNTETVPNYTDAKECKKAFDEVFAWYRANHVSGSAKGRPTTSLWSDATRAARDRKAREGAKKNMCGLSATFTPEACFKIVNLLKTGAYVETVSEACGIGSRTLYTWLGKGDDEEASVYKNPYRALNVAVHQAVAAVEIFHVNNVNRASHNGEKGVEHSKWMLKNRFSRRWMGTEKIDITTDGQPLPAGSSPAFAETLFVIVDQTSASKPTEVEKAASVTEESKS